MSEKESMSAVLEKMLQMQKDLDYVKYWCVNLITMFGGTFDPAVLIDGGVSEDLSRDLKLIYNKSIDLKRENESLKSKHNGTGLDGK